ncbi:MAG: DUF2066 domain-containing protein [Algicola sp.]|nr:DUF2066 domain-containing protein [Algicola sp.]
MPVVSTMLMLASSVSAIEVPDLYQASAVVTSQSPQARKISQRAAFKKVLVKVSGNNSVLDHPQIKRAISKAADYVRQFQFGRNEDNEQLLLATFDEAKINKLLRRESLPIWGKRRPSILLWMVGEDSDCAVRRVVSKESYGHLRSQIVKVSKDRGLPVLFPLYDLEDNQKVSVSDVWGHFYEHIKTFSLRYKTDSIVLSRFWYEADPDDPEGNNDKNWKLEWRLFESDALVELKLIEGDLNQVLDQLVNNMADRYAAEYAVKVSNLDNAPRMIMTIRNVARVESLIEAEKLLLSFSAVADVLLKTVNNDVAEFEILLVGESLDLLQGMDLEQRFEKIFDALADLEQQPIEYRWVP